jgi:hypothetical protein
VRFIIMVQGIEDSEERWTCSTGVLQQMAAYS